MSQSFDSVQEYLPYFFDVTTNYYYRNPDNRDKIFSGGNEMRPSVKEGKYKVFTFADRNREREINMKAFKERIEEYPIIDEVKVFNRWGELVFHSNDDTEEWDGKNCLTGIYVYVINYKNSKGKTQQTSGKISLIN